MRKRRRERIGKGAAREDKEREKREERDKRELRRQLEEEEEEHHHLSLLVVQLPQGTAALLRRHEFPTISSAKALYEVVGVANGK